MEMFDITYFTANISFYGECEKENFKKFLKRKGWKCTDKSAGFNNILASSSNWAVGNCFIILIN